MKRWRRDDNCRVLVTGSRGKSSIVRLLHTAFAGAGKQVYSRITGVLPRELTPVGSSMILRSAGAHVEEMRWWLKQLPTRVEAVVLENSAIATELQGLAGRWLQPQVAVLANCLPDHQEVWGPTAHCAVAALLAGIPKRCVVVIPQGLGGDLYLRGELARRNCPVVVVPPGAQEDYREQNIRLALAAIKACGLDPEMALQAMRAMPSDHYDFHVVQNGGVEMALAFSANDIGSTEKLFRSLHWKKEDTCLVFNHRADRPGRLDSFMQWLGDLRWREVMIIGDNPRRQIGGARFCNVKRENAFLRCFQPGDRIFGCGNIAGLPLGLTAVLERRS